MKPVVVFLGPTLRTDEAEAVLDAYYLPPAGHGDVLREALRRPRAIAIVDGVFERVPAIWHKEILFALAEGVHVYGSSSMGALRAAELDVFGMRGVGEIYRAYADGTLEDDDEVAVAHGDAEDAFAARSDAMVDIRATLGAAVAQDVVSDAVARDLECTLKATFYAQRLLLAALDRDDDDHERLRAWLPSNRVSAKRDDALTLLRTISEDLEAGLEPPRPTWTLQRSRYWDDARRSLEVASEAAPGAEWAHLADEELAAVLDEARLDPGRYERLLDASLLTALARDSATAAGVVMSTWAGQEALDEERRRRGLLEPDEVRAWLEGQGLGEVDLHPVVHRLAVLRWARLAHRDAVAGEVALTLRTGGDYAELARRAALKRDVLVAFPAARAAEIADADVLAWYFGDRLGEEVPVALEAWAATRGWPRVSDLLRALRAEWWFERMSTESPDEAGVNAGPRASHPQHRDF